MITTPRACAPARARGDRYPAAAQKDRTEANSLMPGIEAEFAGYGLKFDEPLPAKTNAVTTKKVN